MPHKPFWLFMVVTFLFLQLATLGPSSALEIPHLPGRVNDLAGILSPTESSHLEQKLSAIETETTNQIAILIIPSLEGNPLEEFSIRVARAWALGQKGRNNGVLILMSVEDRAVRIEVGYGLEGALTDAQSSYIIRNIMVPAFRQQLYAEGLSRAVDAIAAAIAGEFKAEPKTPDSESKQDLSEVIFVTIFLLIFFSMIRTFQPVLSGLIGAVLGFINVQFFSPAPTWIYILFALIGSVVGISIYYMNVFSFGRQISSGPTSWSGGSRGIDFGGRGGLGGGGFSGGGFSGGGGSFGGGGASGRW